MRVNFFTTLIALALSGLIAYGFYSFNNNTEKDLLTFGSFIFMFFTLLFIIGIRYKYYPRNLTTKIVSAAFFFTALATNLIFSFIVFTQQVYIVVNGILFLLFILSMYLMQKRFTGKTHNNIT